MKKSLGYIFPFLLLLACGKPENEKLEAELVPLIAEVSMNKIEEAKSMYSGFYSRMEDNINWPKSTRTEMTNRLKETNLDEVHAIAERFYVFCDKLVDQNINQGTSYVSDTLINRFKLSSDSIATLTPESLQSFDYTQSLYRENLLLTAMRMKYDMAELEMDAMDKEAEKLPTIFYDSFAGADTVALGGYQYVRIPGRKK